MRDNTLDGTAVAEEPLTPEEITSELSPGRLSHTWPKQITPRLGGTASKDESSA
jgi:hypothetical protein